MHGSPEEQRIQSQLLLETGAGFVLVHSTSTVSNSFLVPAKGSQCSNPEVWIRKKLQDKSEAAVRTPSQRASKQVPYVIAGP